jgi:acyl-CoA thioester hydrolase
MNNPAPQGGRNGEYMRKESDCKPQTGPARRPVGGDRQGSKIHAVEQPVRYAETDRMRVVHHSTYLLWFEVGRTELLASVGFSYREVEAGGTLLPVIAFSCDLFGPADYGDTVRIETRISHLRSRSVEFAYEVFNRGKKIAMGMTRHVSVDENQKPKRLPDPLYKTLSEFAGLKNESGNP